MARDPFVTWPALTLAVMVICVIIVGVRRYSTGKELGGTKLMLFFGFLVLAPLTLTFALNANMEKAKDPEFCGSCHLMEPKLADIRNPESDNLAAIHTQRGFIQREQCYTCHSDYHMFGTAKTKMRGMKHLWADLFNEGQTAAHLYQPFPNSNCLQCHDGKRRFEENMMHSDILADLKANKTRCVECHDNIHPKQPGEE